MIRWAAALLAVATGLAQTAPMKASKPEVRKAVVAVIEAQLTAFRKGDAAEAHRHASTELRRQKPLSVFTEIVRASYPEIWANRRADAGIVRDDGVNARVVVRVYSNDGDASYDYLLVKEPDGWRVHGVVRHEVSGKKV